MEDPMPIAAASILEWKTIGTGQSYRDWRAAELGQG